MSEARYFFRETPLLSIGKTRYLHAVFERCPTQLSIEAAHDNRICSDTTTRKNVALRDILKPNVHPSTSLANSVNRASTSVRSAPACFRLSVVLPVNAR